MNKEQELCSMIENIEKAYDPSSPGYKFRYIFYNKTSSPFTKPHDFPDDLWYNSLKKDVTLMPVLLKGTEIESRRKGQLDTMKNLKSSYNFIKHKIDDLKLKSERIRNKLQGTLVVYRRIVNNVYNKCRTRKNNCNMMEEIDKINVDVKKREYFVEDKKSEVIGYLVELKNNLHGLLGKIEEDLYEYERKMFVFKNINKLNY
ncbi:hypothetical protein P3W45_001719 [Vairimorpha bombi]|jgi:prefoldin subunit 5